MHLVARSSSHGEPGCLVSFLHLRCWYVPVARELGWMKLVNECHMRAFYEYGCAPVLVRIER